MSQFRKKKIIYGHKLFYFILVLVFYRSKFHKLFFVCCYNLSQNILDYSLKDLLKSI